SRPSGWAATGGRRNARSPGWRGAGGCGSATTGTPSATSRSRCWPVRGWATTGFPVPPRPTHGHPDPRFRNVLLCDLLGRSVLTVVVGFVFCRRDIPDRAVEPALVPPLHPRQRRQLELLGASPWTVATDQF